MSDKVKKLLNIVVDVVVFVILALVLILAVSAITSKAKGYDGYTAIFGKAYVAVSSDSMKGDQKDNFSKGDLIVIKLLSEDDLTDLKEGDIITFRTKEITQDDTYVLNTHRIVKIVESNGTISEFITHGDNNPYGDVNNVETDSNYEHVSANKVVGLYQAKAGGIGHVMLFMNSSAGFFVCVVLPSLLVVVYFAVNLVLVILKEKKVQAVAEGAAKQDEKERMRAELLAELAANGQIVTPVEGKSEESAKTDDVTSDSEEEKK
jgi:signal peptidase I